MRVETKPDQAPAEAAARDEDDSAEPAPVAPAGKLTLAQRMALPEPRRTAELERAAERGEQFYLRSRSRKQIRQRYGGIIITVGREPKGFSAAHAIHLLWYCGEAIEEVPGPEG